jgi:uncharacterized damage-inducible protein DinB
MKKIFLPCFIAILAFFSQGASAQLSETLKTQFLKDWERAKVYTQKYLETMPTAKYDFKATDSIRSFAQQMLHLAWDNNLLVSTATGKDRKWTGQPLEQRKSAEAPDSVNYYITASYDYAIDAIKNMDFSKLEEKMKLGSREETRLALLLKAFEHQTHHRGQTTIYIRLQSIKPPNEMLF